MWYIKDRYPRISLAAALRKIRGNSENNQEHQYAANVGYALAEALAEEEVSPYTREWDGLVERAKLAGITHVHIPTWDDCAEIGS